MANPRQYSTPAASPVPVTSAAEVPILGTANGFGLYGVGRWGMAVKIGAGGGVTLRFYKSWGSACGLTIVSDLTEVLLASASFTREFPSETATDILVTAQATTTDTTVALDFAGRAQ